MTPYVWAWLLSLTAAALFFAAGLFFARHRVALAMEKMESDAESAALSAPRLAPVEQDPLDLSHSKIIALPNGPYDPEIPADGPVSGDVLRAVLERESERPDLTGAVIADELGLVVASTGELSDALAAYGAVLAGIGAKSCDSLPLHDVRHIVVTDDHDMTLTVRKIEAVDEQFALVTLTSGHDHVRPQATAGR